MRITPFDWLHPAIPSPLIPVVKAVGRGIELLVHAEDADPANEVLETEARPQ